MSTYIILPGGWAGGWQSSRMAKLLKDAGHAVITPVYKWPSTVSETDAVVNAQVQDVLSALERENLRDVVLVGFALSEDAASRVIEQAPERIRHLVFVDARMSANGDGSTDSSTHTYLRCTAGSGFAAATAPAAYKARAAGWAYAELPPEGESRVALPEELAEALLKMA